MKKTGLLALIALVFINGCFSTNKYESKTKISILQNQWYFNGRIINKNSLSEGLLMNVRMVNSVFEDAGTELKKHVSGFEADDNTNAFIAKIPEYVSAGVNAFTISLQGGYPGYEGAINTAYYADGSLKKEYLERVKKAIKACDKQNATVILSCLYQRQHSHNHALNGKTSIKNAVGNVVKWIKSEKFSNVVLEIANEYRHGGYQNWSDGIWLTSEAGQIELIKLAKQLNPELLVSTSGMGEGDMSGAIANEVDFILIHFNNTPVDSIVTKIDKLKKYNKPLVCNEDNKLNIDGAAALAYTVTNGCGGGYMNMKRNQEVPFLYLGTEDDPIVYKMFRELTTPGFNIDARTLRQMSVVISYPRDGQIFKTGQKINIGWSHLHLNDTTPYSFELLSNNRQIAIVGGELNDYEYKFDIPGIYYIEVVVKDIRGNELYRSPKVDIIIRDSN